MFDQEITDLAAEVLDAARRRGWMIATAESCTGGLVSGALTAIAGSSDVLDRGFVTYSNDAKQQMLGVSSESLGRFGAVSEPVAKEMAYGALSESRADITLAITGIAGPGGGSAERPVGLVWFATATQGRTPDGFYRSYGDKGRSQVRRLSVVDGLMALLQKCRGDLAD
ncbi:CinA family protein [Yunchengibacter salinarum]|uniref:CinA family protein n=1 Tax=Yunchengibacter salinarum TaxID=3133399 RepID=UPI0035B6A7F5